MGPDTLAPSKDNLSTLSLPSFSLDPRSTTTPTDTTTASTQAITKDAQSKPVSKVSPEKNLAVVLTHTDSHSKLWTVTELVAVPEPTTPSSLTAAATVKSKP